jgi:hypothetical protein
MGKNECESENEIGKREIEKESLRKRKWKIENEKGDPYR